MSRRNKDRRKDAARKQEPLPKAEQEARAAGREAERAEHGPPVYREIPGTTQKPTGVTGRKLLIPGLVMRPGFRATKRRM